MATRAKRKISEITEEEAERLADIFEDPNTEWSEPVLVVEQTERRSAGRPSLTGAGERSPMVSFRLPAKLRESAAARAEAEGKSISVMAREALEQYLAG